MRYLILIAALLSACSSPERDAEAGVRKLLHGGASLEFMGLHRTEKGVCGHVRSTDRVGEVAEWTPFVWTGGRAWFPGDPAYQPEIERVGC